MNTDGGNTRGPQEIDGREINTVIGFAETFLQNFNNYPAVSVPAGFTKSGFPVGMQIITPRTHDLRALQIARAWEAISPWNYEIPLNREI